MSKVLGDLVIKSNCTVHMMSILGERMENAEF